MHTMLRKVNHWLLPVVLILFILEVITFALVPALTYSGRSEYPDHLLTYSPGVLVWDSAIGIDENGVAVLDLFDEEYDGVKSSDGKNVVAPGTEGFSIVRLKSTAWGTVNYTAVLYQIVDDERIPIEACLEGNGFEDATEYLLPPGVLPEQVIRAVEGEIHRNQIQDFDIKWKWQFETGEGQDMIDTVLGDQSVLIDDEQVKVGIYIVVTDYNNYEDQNSGLTDKPSSSAGTGNGTGVPGESDEHIKSDDTQDDKQTGEAEDHYLQVLPKTGDNSRSDMYLALMAISGIVLILLLIDRKMEMDRKE